MMSAFLSVCAGQINVLSSPWPSCFSSLRTQNTHTHIHTRLRPYAYRAVCLLLIPAVHSLRCHQVFITRWHCMARTHSHTGTRIHTHTCLFLCVLAECVRAGLLLLSGGGLGWGLKRLWNLPRGTSTQSCFMPCHMCPYKHSVV